MIASRDEVAGEARWVVLEADGVDGLRWAVTSDPDPLLWELPACTGRVRVVERTDGTRLLEVELSAPELDDAYYEVWLLRPDVLSTRLEPPNE